MKKQLLFLLAIVAMLFGCSEDVLLDDYAKSTDENAPQSEMLKENKGKAVTKTIKMRGYGSVEYTPHHISDEGMQVYLATVEGQGNASHLGLFEIDLTYYAMYIPIPDSDPIVYTYWPISPITGIQTAANGDQLFTAAYGPNPDGSLHFMYNNGTGRFEYVTGYVNLFFNWSDDFNWENFGEGEITY
jgi:hypothetical protein